MFKILTSTVNLPYTDWLEYRRLGIGGSDASVVCGINQYKSPVELYMEKIGMLHPQEAGEAAYWGNRLENLVREEFTLRTGLEVTLANQILQSEAYPFMLANLDGIVESPDHGTCIFEAKTAGAFMSGHWENGQLPDAYMLQIQHYMAVTGYAGAYVAVLIGGNNFKWLFTKRDEELITFLIQLESDFWGCVQSNTPSLLDGSDASARFLSNRFPNSVPLTKIELPPTALGLVRKYDAATSKVDEYTGQKQEAENLLKQMLGEHEAGTIGDRIITWKTFTQERIDTKSLKAEHPTLCNIDLRRGEKVYYESFWRLNDEQAHHHTYCSFGYIFYKCTRNSILYNSDIYC